MFPVTDIRMGEFCEGRQARQPLVGSYLVAENWPSVKRSPQMRPKVSEPAEVCRDYSGSNLGPQMPSFYVIFFSSLKTYTSLSFLLVDVKSRINHGLL